MSRRFRNYFKDILKYPEILSGLYSEPIKFKQDIGVGSTEIIRNYTDIPYYFLNYFIYIRKYIIFMEVMAGKYLEFLFILIDFFGCKCYNGFIKIKLRLGDRDYE
jgi:hypothetical protein